MASTWFHATKGRCSGSLVRLFRPFSFLGVGSDQLLQLAALEHLHHDVRAADKFALHVKLGNGRPIRIFLDPLANFGVLKDVDGLVLRAEAIVTVIARSSSTTESSAPGMIARWLCGVDSRMWRRLCSK